MNDDLLKDLISKVLVNSCTISKSRNVVTGKEGAEILTYTISFQTGDLYEKEMDVIIGSLEYNLKKIVKEIRDARNQKHQGL